MAEITTLLQRATAGDGDAREPLFRLLYPELMQMARGQLSRAGTVSLDQTAVVHDLYLRLAAAGGLPDANRRVFFSYASKVMHSVIVDYVRERGTQKRGGDATRLTLTDGAPSLFVEYRVDDLEAALTALAAVDDRAFRVVEMRYFAGMTEEDIASVLDLSLATVRRDWRKARAFLYDRLR